MAYRQENIKPYDSQQDKTEQVTRMFDNIAHSYDRLNHTLSLGIDRWWRHHAINQLKAYQPQQLLDIATGTGDFALLAYKLLQPAHIFGADISEGMMEIGRKKVAEAGLSDKITFQNEDCCKGMSFASDSMDAITIQISC